MSFSFLTSVCAHPSTRPHPLLHYPHSDPSFQFDKHNPHQPLKTPFLVSHFLLWGDPVGGATHPIIILSHFPVGPVTPPGNPCSSVNSYGRPLSRIALTKTFAYVLWSWCLLGSSFLFQVLQLFRSENFLVFRNQKSWKNRTKRLVFLQSFLCISHNSKNTKKSSNSKQPTTKINKNKTKVTSHSTHKIILLRGNAFYLVPWVASCMGCLMLSFWAQRTLCWHLCSEPCLQPLPGWVSLVSSLGQTRGFQSVLILNIKNPKSFLVIPSPNLSSSCTSKQCT